MNNRERLQKWASELTEEQAKDLLVDLVVHGIGAEDISFYSDTLSPYWKHCGDPLVEGQKTYSDED